MLVTNVAAPAPGWGRRRHLARSQGGFTLVEIIVCVGLLGILITAISAISISGTNQLASDTLSRHLDSTAAQLLGTSYARDVEGASQLGATACGTTALGTALVTFVASTDATTVTYRDLLDTGTHSIVRAACSSTGTLLSSTTLATDIATTPTVSCAPTTCVTSGTPPRTVTLNVNRSTSFTFAFDATRRTSATTVGAVLPAQLFALGGTTPLGIGGNGSLTVTGNVVINSSAATAVSMGGANSRLNISGTFRILTGGVCSGCNATKVPNKYPPGSFSTALADPLGYLPAPDETGVAAGSCSGGTGGTCTPGIYASAMNLSSASTLKPGIYILRKGGSFSGNGAITGSGVFLFNGCGLNAPPGCSNSQAGFAVSGQAAVSLTPMTSGVYSKILYYQARSNGSAFSISGGSGVMSFSGVLYAPTASAVTLGAGGGGLTLGAVVGQSLSLTGNGAVSISGS